MVSLCSLICLIGVCADRDQPEFLCSRSDSRHLEVHVATAGGWLTRYRPRDVRNSIYRYWKIHIDYRSKFLYRFISPISIIYGITKSRYCVHHSHRMYCIWTQWLVGSTIHYHCWTRGNPPGINEITPGPWWKHLTLWPLATTSNAF